MKRICLGAKQMFDSFVESKFQQNQSKSKCLIGKSKLRKKINPDIFLHAVPHLGQKKLATFEIGGRMSFSRKNPTLN